MAIRLRAVKDSTTTGAIVCAAVQSAFSKEVEEAKAVLADKDEPAKPDAKRRKS
jgi:hypothetical protein